MLDCRANILSGCLFYFLSIFAEGTLRRLEPRLTDHRQHLRILPRKVFGEDWHVIACFPRRLLHIEVFLHLLLDPLELSLELVLFVVPRLVELRQPV